MECFVAIAKATGYAVVTTKRIFEMNTYDLATKAANGMLTFDAANVPELPAAYESVELEIASAIEAAHGIGGQHD